MTRRRLAIAALGLALLGCGVRWDTPTHPISYPTPAPASTAAAYVRHPITSVTPGNVITRDAGDVCMRGWAGAHRDALTVKEKRYVLTLYGLPEGTPVSEWDHLVSLELGGGNGMENIWPMTDHAQDQRKDRLENRLHADVCAARISLPTAQREIREFWRHW